MNRGPRAHGRHRKFLDKTLHQMTYFKAKMHQIRFRLGLCPRPSWGAYSASRPPSWIWGQLHSRGGDGLGKRRERGGREREGPPSYC